MSLLSCGPQPDVGGVPLLLAASWVVCVGGLALLGPRKCGMVAGPQETHTRPLGAPVPAGWGERASDR
eukprot:4432094-Prymnesium_polylepis.1